jgi:hypothetical protein
MEPLTKLAAVYPKDEAIPLLSEVLSNFLSPGKDVKSIFRICQHICELLNWEKNKTWFYQELNGYYQGSSLPEYRKIVGVRKWEVGGSEFDKVSWFSEELVYGVDPTVYQEEVDYLEVWAGIDWFISASSTGYKELLNDYKRVKLPSKESTITLQRTRIFTSQAISFALSTIEKIAFDFISRTYVQLKYSNAISTVWAEYQSQVDNAISNLGFSCHLSAIESNLLSSNPESWRIAAFECRNLLTDLANYLWRDTRARYDYLPGKTESGKLDVTQQSFGNRLSAYIHQKGIFGTKGKYMRDEACRLSESLHSLISYQSEAHEPLNHQNARSVAIATYILIGELATRTDLVPVYTYKEPSIKDDK